MLERPNVAVRLPYLLISLFEPDCFYFIWAHPRMGFASFFCAAAVSGHPM